MSHMCPNHLCGQSFPPPIRLSITCSNWMQDFISKFVPRNGGSSETGSEDNEGDGYNEDEDDGKSVCISLLVTMLNLVTMKCWTHWFTFKIMQKEKQTLTKTRHIFHLVVSHPHPPMHPQASDTPKQFHPIWSPVWSRTTTLSGPCG